MGPAGDEDLRSWGLWYRWNQTSLRMGPPVDTVALRGLGKRFAAGNQVQPQLKSAHGRLNSSVLHIFNDGLGERRPNRDSAAPSLRLRASKLWYLMSALLHRTDDLLKQRQKFALAGNGDVVLLLSWLMAFTRVGDVRPRDAAHDPSEESKLKRESSACRHVAGVSVAARDLLVEPRSARKEEAWTTLVA